MITRREWLKGVAGGAVAAALTRSATPLAADKPFQLQYALASSLYGTLPIADVLREVRPSGSEYIDLWPKVHADHREQVAELGEERFAALLAEHQVKLGMTTRYDLGPFRLEEELAFVQRLGGKLIVTGAERSPGDATKEQARAFAQKLRPVAQLAEKHRVIVAIENHSGMLLKNPDTIRWFADAIDSPWLGIAFAPSHLPQDAKLLGQLIADLGSKLVHFYAWQKGDGFLSKLPKEEELKQLPGRGELDFGPLLAALRGSHYDGWVQIFMHPTPRGVPILETAGQVTAAVNASRAYLSQRLATAEVM